MSEKINKHPLFHPKFFLMDLARVSILPIHIYYRIKRHYIVTQGSAPGGQEAIEAGQENVSGGQEAIPSGQENMPAKQGRLKGGALIVGNHCSFEDPIFYVSNFWYRRVFFMAGENLLTGGAKSFWLKQLGCIRVDRNISDIESIRTCVERLKQGFVLGMFPQGGIKRDQDLSAIKGGAVLIAMQADVPIIPMYSERPKRWYQRRHIVIGTPINCKDYCKKKFPSMADMNQITEVVRNSMLACEEAFRQGQF